MRHLIVLFLLAALAIITLGMENGETREGLYFTDVGFQQHIKPIFEKHCSGCHIGSLDYETSVRQKDKILEKVTKREMPPRYRLQLSEQEVALVQEWVRQGAEQ